MFNSQNSSQKLKDVAKYMNLRAAKSDCMFRGHYTLADDKVEFSSRDMLETIPSRHLIDYFNFYQLSVIQR